MTETPRTKSLLLEVPEWEGHKAGQQVDVRLTAEDGYQAQRSYSIASAPEDERLMLAVDRLDDGEVSPYLTDVLMAGDKLELRGEVFSFEVTTAHYACEICGRADQIGAAMVYEVRGLGTIMRYPSCENALIRFAHNRGQHWIDLRGIRYLRVEDVAE